MSKAFSVSVLLVSLRDIFNRNHKIGNWESHTHTHKYKSFSCSSPITMAKAGVFSQSQPTFVHYFNHLLNIFPTKKWRKKQTKKNIRFPGIWLNSLVLRQFDKLCCAKCNSLICGWSPVTCPGWAPLAGRACGWMSRNSLASRSLW